MARPFKIRIAAAQRLWLWMTALMLGLLGCSLSSAADSSTPTLTNDREAALTFAPVVTMTPTIGLPGLPSPIAPNSPTLTATAPTVVDPCGTPMLPEVSIAHYEVNAAINPIKHTVRAAMTATYRNQTGRVLNDLVLNIDSNRAPGIFRLEALSATATIARSSLDGARLYLETQPPVARGCSISVTLQFTLTIPPLSEAKMRYLSYTEHQLNLGYWLPEFAPFIGGEWHTPKRTEIGEYMYSEMGTFDVTTFLEGAEDRPTMEIIGPGSVERVGARSWHFFQRESRVFSLLVSDAMAHLSTKNDSGLTIDLYHILRLRTATPDAAEPADFDAPGHVLKIAREATLLYTNLFGPLPHDRLVIIEGEYPDGMELDGLVYVSRQWFTTFRGKLDSWLTLITVHELAHQWWYALVANDQALNPYLDEALALYCEVLYLENRQADLVPWWWTFRVKAYQPTGPVDSAVAEFTTGRQYINAVYLRGASLLQDIRATIGDSAFFNWLQTYLKAGRDRIVTPIDLWAALPRDSYLAISAIRGRYLRNSDPLALDAAMSTETAIRRTPTRRPSQTPTMTEKGG